MRSVALGMLLSTAVTAHAGQDEEAETPPPQVDPVQLDAAAAVPAAEQKRICEEAAASALSYASRLPNFGCNREPHRLTASVKRPDNFREANGNHRIAAFHVRVFIDEENSLIRRIVLEGSVLQVRKGKQVVRNETRFRDYRKFDAYSEIKF